jgi:hypothetical protein
MSFSFNAMGTRDEVIQQVTEAPIYDNEIGQHAKDLIRNALLKESTTGAYAGAGYEHRYLVEAAGHSGPGAATSLTLKIEPRYVKKISTETATTTETES